jgi:hypothetical protein
VVHRNRKHERLGVDRPQLDVVTDRGRTQHTEVKGAGAQVLALVGSQHVGPDLQRDAGQFALDDPGDAGQMREAPRFRSAQTGSRPLRPAAIRRHTAHGAVHTREDAGGFGLQELTRQRSAIPAGWCG